MICPPRCLLLRVKQLLTLDLTNCLFPLVPTFFIFPFYCLLADRVGPPISKISAQELKEVGRDELTGVNLGQVDPATLQATKIACGAHMCGLVRCNYFRVWKNEWWMNSGTRSATTSVCCGSWGRSQKKVLCYRNWWDAWPTRLQSRQACLLKTRQHPYRDCIKSCRIVRGAARTLRSFRLQGDHRFPSLWQGCWFRSDVLPEISFSGIFFEAVGRSFNL